jgi:sortase A
MPTTTVAPAATVLEAPLKQPIDPPLDPRGHEDHVEIGGIAIPKLGIDTPLLEGIRLTTRDNGPGHWPGSAMPGEVGNVVVAGHRTSHDAPFRDLDQLVAGDVVEFTTAAGLIEYTVTGTQIVDPDAIWIVDPTDTPTATLFACHPPGSTRQRIVVNLELS